MAHAHGFATETLAASLGGLLHAHHDAAHQHVHGGPPSGDPPRLHLRGTLLPDGEPGDIWLVDGRISLTPVTDAVTVATDAWILPGLVDAHCHVGMGPHGPTTREEAERQALADRDAGTLLIRDAGSPSDTRWVDERDDLPRIIRAGRHIARPRRYLRHVAEEVDPDDLVDAVVRQARRGDGWVKLVGDWIDRDLGDLAPLWPEDVARRAIEAAHAEGARVTAHCFDERSVAELVGAGIDGIEHGTGLDDTTIALMAEGAVALVPTMANLENFPQIAASGEARFPRYAAHMRALHARRFETIGKAVDAGVPVYAGTDAGTVMPHGIIAEEIGLLARVAGATFALGAASWRARAWLGRPPLADGAPADLVVLDADPRADLTSLRRPRLIVLRGRVVAGTGRTTG